MDTLDDERCKLTLSSSSSSAFRNVGAVKLERAIDPSSSMEEPIDSSYMRRSRGFSVESLVETGESEKSLEEVGECKEPLASADDVLPALLRKIPITLALVFFASGSFGSFFVGIRAPPRRPVLATLVSCGCHFSSFSRSRSFANDRSNAPSSTACCRSLPLPPRR